jgi:hypothetical protein
MMRTVAVFVALVLSVAAGLGSANADVAAELESAADLLQAGDYAGAERIAAGVVLSGPGLDQHDRAEGWRIYGLSLFFLERKPQAEHALLQYLKLEPDAVLDPALVPPEAIRFFAEVRVDHEAEIARHRPRPRRKRYWALNLTPPAGQFQNRERGKAWVITGVGAALLAANVTSFFVLRDWCSQPGDTCADDAGNDKTDAARDLRRLNYATGIALAGLYVYGVIDGFRSHGRISSDERAADTRLHVDVRPTGEGAVFMLQGRF